MSRWVCGRCGANNMPQVATCFKCGAGQAQQAPAQPTQTMPAPPYRPQPPVPQQYMPPAEYGQRLPGVPDPLAPPPPGYRGTSTQVVHTVSHQGYQRPKMDVCAILSVVFGAIGMISFCFPWPWCILGMVMAGISLYRIAHEEQLTGRGMAWGGFWLSLIPMLFWIGLFLWAGAQPSQPTPLYGPGNRP